MLRDHEQRLELEADVRLCEIGLYLLHQRLVAAEMGSGDGAVDAGAEVCAIAAGDIGCDQFAFTLAQCAGSGKEDFDKVVQGLCGLGTEGHGAADTNVLGGEWDVRHGVLQFSVVSDQ